MPEPMNIKIAFDYELVSRFEFLVCTDVLAEEKKQNEIEIYNFVSWLAGCVTVKQSEKF